MKYLLIAMITTITACGGNVNTSTGYQQEQWEKDYELCTMMDGEPNILSIYNADTGESYYDVECDFDYKNQCEVVMCKPGGNCDSRCDSE